MSDQSDIYYKLMEIGNRETAPTSAKKEKLTEIIERGNYRWFWTNLKPDLKPCKCNTRCKPKFKPTRRTITKIPILTRSLSEPSRKEACQIAWKLGNPPFPLGESTTPLKPAKLNEPRSQLLELVTPNQKRKQGEQGEPTGIYRLRTKLTRSKSPPPGFDRETLENLKYLERKRNYLPCPGNGARLKRVWETGFLSWRFCTCCDKKFDEPCECRTIQGSNFKVLFELITYLENLVGTNQTKSNLQNIELCLKFIQSSINACGDYLLAQSRYIYCLGSGETVREPSYFEYLCLTRNHIVKCIPKKLKSKILIEYVRVLKDFAYRILKEMWQQENLYQFLLQQSTLNSELIESDQHHLYLRTQEFTPLLLNRTIQYPLETIKLEPKQKNKRLSQRQHHQSQPKESKLRKRKGESGLGALRERKRRKDLGDLQALCILEATKISKKDFKELQIKRPNHNRDCYKKLAEAMREVSNIANQVCDLSLVPYQDDLLSRLRALLTKIKKKKRIQKQHLET